MRRSFSQAASAAFLLLTLHPCSYAASFGPVASALGEQPRHSESESLVDRDVTVNAAANAAAAIDAMNLFYNHTDGRWSTSDAWWVSGNALQAILDYSLKTGSDAYLPYAEHTFRLQRAPLPWWPEGEGDFRADSTDDTGWWALAMVRFYDVTGNGTYLDVAKEDEAYMYKYWNDDECGGGLIWDIPSQTYKNAVSNELYIALAIALHRRIPGDTEYLEKARTAWEWFHTSGMINPQHLINDGLAETENGQICFNNGQPVWTYNQGIILGALVGLHNATGDDSYLFQAMSIADAVVDSSTLSPKGTLTESCEKKGDCDGNQQMFKGIFCRNLAELNNVLPDHPYREYLVNNARTMMVKDKNSTNFYDVRWNGPFVSSTIAKQASAVSLLVALI